MQLFVCKQLQISPYIVPSLLSISKLALKSKEKHRINIAWVCYGWMRGRLKDCADYMKIFNKEKTSR
jgi:hypothetical protein